MSKTKLQKAIEAAKLLGSPWVEVDGIKIPLVTTAVPVELKLQTDDELKKVMAEDPFDYTDEEILYFHSEYFDELQEKKKKRQDALLAEEQVREDKDVKRG